MIRSLKNETKVKELKELVPNAKYPLELCEANLENKDSWVAAVQRCSYIFHLASPVPTTLPKDPEVVVGPIIRGTLNVLSACAETDTVKKVILTSPTAAIACGLDGHLNRTDHRYTERDFSIPEVCRPYERSKYFQRKLAYIIIIHFATINVCYSDRCNKGTFYKSVYRTCVIKVACHTICSLQKCQLQSACSN